MIKKKRKDSTETKLVFTFTFVIDTSQHTFNFTSFESCQKLLKHTSLDTFAHYDLTSSKGSVLSMTRLGRKLTMETGGSSWELICFKEAVLVTR